MTILCNDNTYVIYYTDSRKGTIQIPKRSIISNVLDITFVGKNRLNYGEAFDENMLHLLEHFAAPESATNPNNPDTDVTFGTLLENPTEGQMWYNITRKRLYVLNNVGIWLPLSNNDDFGGNSGVILNGQQIPLPISTITGQAFTYAECSWNVSPFYFPNQIDYMECFTNSTGVVTARYKLHGSGTLTPGYANYQIFGIKGNINQGFNTPIGPSGTLPPTPTQTPTPTASHTPVTPTPTPSITPTMSLTPTVTPTPTPSPGIEYYMYSSFNSIGGTGNLGIGTATNVSFANSSVIPVTDYVMGRISTDGVNIYVPFYNQGLKIYQKISGVLTQIDFIALDAGFKLLDASISDKGKDHYLLTTLMQDAANPANVRCKIYSITLNHASWHFLLTGVINTTNTGFGSDFSSSMVIHKGYIMIMKTPGTLYAYSQTGTLLDTYILTSGHNHNITTDDTYMYIQTGYDNPAAKNPRYILTFNTNTLKFATTLILTNDGDLGVASGAGYLFTGFSGTEIIARGWDGIVLSPPLDSVQFEVPTYGYHFAYSNANARLYNPLDQNLAFSSAYGWNGTSFTTLYSFRPEADAAKTMCAFTLGFVTDSTVA